MALEVLNNILEAEKRAGEIIQAVEYSSGEAVKNAETAAKERERRAAIDNRALYQQLLEEKRSIKAQDLDAKKKDRQLMTKEMVKQAENRLNQAVSLIVGEVVNGHR